MRPARCVVVAVGALALTACSTGTGTTPTSSATTPISSPTASSPTPEPSTTSASPTSASPSPSTTPGVTVLTFTLEDDANCAGGRLGAHNTTVTPLWEKFAKIPASGAVSIAVPTKLTKGMAFDVQCRAWPNTGAVPIIALQYSDAAIGEPPATNAKGQPLGELASYCWAGTKDARSTFTVRGWIDDGDGTPLSGQVAIFADPTVATIGYTDGERWHEAPQGQMGHQDEPYC